MPIVCMPVARMEAIDRAREALAGARECMIDARAVALRSRVEELAFRRERVARGPVGFEGYYVMHSYSFRNSLK